jgi:hypothetical protein
MTDFLEFLNTADLASLTQIPGITRKTAGNIIAARPFDFVEDCAKVPGMSKTLLGKAQSYFETEINESRNSALATIEDDSLPMVIEEETDQDLEDKPSFWSRLGTAVAGFLRILIRLILTVALIVGIGALLYYGLPYLNRTLIAPVEENTAQINRLEDKISSLQSQLEETNGRVSSLETSIEAHTASLEKLTEIQENLEERLRENNDQALQQLQHEVMTARALDMLGRARVYLAQSNFGLAKEDIQNARDLLVVLQSETHEEVLEQVLERLDLALGNLPAFPVVAAGDLEIAWQMLISGEASVIPIVPTPTLVLSFTPTPVPSPTVEIVPTP